MALFTTKVASGRLFPIASTGGRLRGFATLFVELSTCFDIAKIHGIIGGLFARIGVVVNATLRCITPLCQREGLLQRLWHCHGCEEPYVAL